MVTVVMLALQGAAAAASVLFGVSIALVNVLLLVWRSGRANRGPALSAQQSMSLLYLSVFERFAAVAMMFMVGLGVLRLAPLPVLLGFVVALPVLLLQGHGGRG